MYSYYDELKKFFLENYELCKPTQREQDLQALDIAYGNLGCSTNHKPSRKAFVKLAQTMFGFTAEEAEEWALKRKWERE